jgi:hypothetical protein
MLDDGQGHRMAVLRKVTGIQKELEQDGKPQAVVCTWSDERLRMCNRIPAA